jgi:hypothetical protein
MDLSDLREIERQLVEEVSGELEQRGWTVTDARPALLVRNASSEIELQVRLNTDIKSSINRIRFVPALGARHKEISRLLARFQGLPESRPSASPSVGVNLSELLPDRNDIFRWSFYVARNNRDIATLVVSDIARYGDPFLVSVSSIEGILHLLEERPSAQGRDEVLAIAHALNGDLPAARRILPLIEARGREQGPLLLSQSSAFVASFSDYFGVP